MEFKIGDDDDLNIVDSELINLLTEVYVGEGFTNQEDANKLFSPSEVRQRGLILGARCQIEPQKLAGVVILVPPESKARRLAKNNEAEMHLLAVNQEFRNFGLGKKLVMETVNMARKKKYSKIVLWTQDSMIVAQALYESVGFSHIDTMGKNGRKFFVYNLQL